MPQTALPITEVVAAADCWLNEPDSEAVIQRALATAASAVGVDAGGAELAVLLTDDAGIRSLNKDFRGIDKPTNVLSFPVAQAATARAADDASRMLGDIAIAYETVRREAGEAHKPFAHHLSHLAVHGFLHLLGYDHQSPAQARRMESTERAILRALAVPDPYAALRPRPKAFGRTTAKRHGRKPGGELGRERARPARNA